MDLAVQAHVVHKSLVVDADFFDTGLDAFAQGEDAGGRHGGGRLDLLRASSRTGFAAHTQPDASAIENGFFVSKPNTVHDLGRLQIHLMKKRAAGRAFAALKTKIAVLPANAFNLLRKRHFETPGS